MIFDNRVRIALFTGRALIQAAFHLKEADVGRARASLNEFKEMGASSQTC